MTFGGNEQNNSWQKYEIYLTFSKRLHLHSLIFISDTKRVSKSRSEAPDDAVVIAVPWPQNEAFSWTKHSNHVPGPRQQSITWPGFFRFDMLRPIMLLLVNLRCQWGNKCYHGPGLVRRALVRVTQRALVRIDSAKPNSSAESGVYDLVKKSN